MVDDRLAEWETAITEVAAVLGIAVRKPNLPSDRDAMVFYIAKEGNESALVMSGLELRETISVEEVSALARRRMASALA